MRNRVLDQEMILTELEELKMQDGERAFLNYWKTIGLVQFPPTLEYEFTPFRKWRFDFAWIKQKVAVEINGNAWKTEGGGRHGKDDDLEKLNVAVGLGWRVFQFTPSMLSKNPQDCVDQIATLLKGIHSESKKICAICGRPEYSHSSEGHNFRPRSS